MPHSLHRRARLLAPIPFLFVLLIAAQAFGQDQGAAAEEEETAAHKSNIVGIHFFTARKVGGVEAGEPHTEIGAALAYERVILPRMLALEVAFSYAHDLADAEVVSAEGAAKLPVELTENVECFVGAGPVLAVEVGDHIENGESHGHSAHAYPGIDALAGTYFWFGANAGMDMAVKYIALFERPVAHEIVWELAGVMRF